MRPPSASSSSTWSSSQSLTAPTSSLSTFLASTPALGLMLDLEYELKGVSRRNRDGSRMTQAQREQRLRQIARDLDRLGYHHLRSASLKPKHVQALVDDWHAKWPPWAAAATWR